MFANFTLNLMSVSDVHIHSLYIDSYVKDSDPFFCENPYTDFLFLSSYC